MLTSAQNRTFKARPTMKGGVSAAAPNSEDGKGHIGRTGGELRFHMRKKWRPMPPIFNMYWFHNKTKTRPLFVMSKVT